MTDQTMPDLRQRLSTLSSDNHFLSTKIMQLEEQRKKVAEKEALTERYREQEFILWERQLSLV